MFLSQRGIEKLSPLDRKVQTEDLAVYWRGFAYKDGITAGTSSITAFAEEAARGLPAASARLKGNYFVAVKDRRSGDCYAFVDSNAMFQAFHSDESISTSFLDLAAQKQSGFGEIDAEALVEFFQFGNIYFDRTLISGIRKIQGEEILCLPQGQGVVRIPKPVPNLDVPPSLSFLECMSSFARAASQEKISVDLTGGHDSRLLAVALKYFGAQFEVLTSGQEITPDVVIAKEVAEVLGVHHHREVPDATGLESSLPEMFSATDGLCDVVRCHRPYEVQKKRALRGSTLLVSGVAGECLREHWWLQDFPFYWRRSPLMGRFYDYRLCPVPLSHKLLVGRYREASESYRDRILRGLDPYVLPSNTQTYDQIVYAFRHREYSGRFLSNYRDLLSWYAPYLERDVARVGYHLKRSQRFFNTFHRQTMTRLNPAASRIRTTEGGMTISSEPTCVLRDFSKYVNNRMSRLATKLRERSGIRTVPQGSPNDPRLSSVVRDLPQLKAGLLRLKNVGMLIPGARIEDLSPTQMGTVVTLGMFFDYLEKSCSEKMSAAGESAILASFR